MEPLMSWNKKAAEPSENMVPRFMKLFQVGMRQYGVTSTVNLFKVFGSAGSQQKCLENAQNTV